METIYQELGKKLLETYAAGKLSVKAAREQLLAASVRLSHEGEVTRTRAALKRILAEWPYRQRGMTHEDFMTWLTERIRRSLHQHDWIDGGGI